MKISGSDSYPLLVRSTSFFYQMPFDLIRCPLQSELDTTPIYIYPRRNGQRRCLEQAMLQDLLTIRADRDNYYYGCDALFTRHPELIHRLCLLVCVKTHTNMIRESDMHRQHLKVDSAVIWHKVMLRKTNVHSQLSIERLGLRK